MALGLGVAALVPPAVQAQDRGRDRRRGARVQVVQGSRYDRSRDHDRFRDYRRSYRDGRSDWSYRSYSYGRPYRSFSYSRPYRYRSYSYAYPYYRGYAYDGYYGGGYYDGYYDNGYYGDYCDDGYYSSYRSRPRVVYPSFRYYRPALGVRVGGPRFGVWLGF
ncbi:MAG: hypothetical protein DMF78_09360 [Acidobacteria bacterium]|nr:MAG: hypothetical protein DMF78_09360 [Acidobacteriota bacterium]